MLVVVIVVVLLRAAGCHAVIRTYNTFITRVVYSINYVTEAPVLQMWIRGFVPACIPLRSLPPVCGYQFHSLQNIVGV